MGKRILTGQRHKKILGVHLIHDVDDNQDTSWLGEYSSQPKGDVYIDRRERGERGYFNVSSNYKGDTLSNQLKYMEQDYQRMEALNRGDWCFIGIRAKAEIVLNEVTQSIHSGGLWGIESDSESCHLKEVEREELEGLKRELLAIGFSERQIDEAFKNVKEAV